MPHRPGFVKCVVTYNSSNGCPLGCDRGIHPQSRCHGSSWHITNPKPKERLNAYSQAGRWSGPWSLHYMTKAPFEFFLFLMLLVPLDAVAVGSAPRIMSAQGRPRMQPSKTKRERRRSRREIDHLFGGAFWLSISSASQWGSETAASTHNATATAQPNIPCSPPFSTGRWVANRMNIPVAPNELQVWDTQLSV
ncbi:hypothetical protein F4802DRAFT_478354 [Xylaria palmicola]|nr:hypothetical protein F4802DRAFT_478354 [Xylaria palmicola]